MKRYSLFALALIILSACNNREQVTISGYYPAGKGQTLSVEMLNVNQLNLIDSLQVKKNGNFKIKFDLKNPELILLKNKSGRLINLIPFPGENITLDIPCDDFSTCYSVEGSVESANVKLLVLEVDRTRLKLDSIASVLRTTKDQEGSDLLVAEYTRILKAQRMYNIKYIIENISSLSSVYALYQRIGPEVYIFSELNDLQYMKIVADSVKTRYPNSSLVTSLVQDVARKLEQYNNILLMNKLSDKEIKGTGSINLEIPDQSGKMVSLNSLNGKVVLVNFWASANQASRDANQKLKGIYKQYHDRGFEVYSVSLDNNKAAWMDAVRYEEYSWIDVCELSYPNSYAASVYNIQNIPATFLIDREGNIVAKNLVGRNLGTWLDNLL